ncbi:hypothetical protein ACFLZ7_03370 [Nanoarchaeota archaeon]
MKKTPKIILIVLAIILALFIILMFIPIEPELVFNETIMVSKESWKNYSFDVYELDDLDVQIEASLPINIFLMTEEQYSRFADKNSTGFSSISEGSAGDVTAKSFKYRVPEDSTYYLILDNMGVVETGAVSVGAVEVKVQVIIS